MEPILNNEIPIIDCHIHYPHPLMKESLMNVTNRLRIDRVNIVCTPHQTRLSLVPDALHLKSHFPDKVFVFGGLDVSLYFREAKRVGLAFAENVDLLRSLGCDGIKMIEAKPQMRKMLPIPSFSSSVFEPYWQKLAEIQYPLLMHVNDPEEFWDAQKVPKWALERGWFYGDGTYINNETQYSEILEVLRKHPNLNVIFAHFFFMSAQLDRLSEWLDQFPNMSIDLTPGIEMYYTFSQNIKKTRDFFLKYQDRILFGTDIGARALLVDPEQGIQFDESQNRVFVVRSFLENDGEFHLNENGFLFGDSNVLLLGLGLPREVLEKIYYKNFERVVSVAPRKPDSKAIVNFCDQLQRIIEIQGSSQPGVPGDASVAKYIGAYFRSIS
jgi:predicted TIM-barrel fold metal-dependent hydrolase